MKNTTTHSNLSPETRRAIVKWLVHSCLGVAAYGLVLFLSAGRLDWGWGWVLLALIAAFLVAHPLILIPTNPALLAERARGLRDPRVKAWDRWIAGLAAGVFPLASWLVAGLDVRWGWTEPLPVAYHLGGLLVTSVMHPTRFNLCLLASYCSAYNKSVSFARRRFCILPILKGPTIALASACVG